MIFILAVLVISLGILCFVEEHDDVLKDSEDEK